MRSPLRELGQRWCRGTAPAPRSSPISSKRKRNNTSMMTTMTIAFHRSRAHQQAHSNSNSKRQVFSSLQAMVLPAVSSHAGARWYMTNPSRKHTYFPPCTWLMLCLLAMLLLCAALLALGVAGLGMTGMFWVGNFLTQVLKAVKTNDGALQPVMTV